MIGSHISIGKDLSKTLKEKATVGMTAAQIFLGSPYSVQRKQVESIECPESLQLFSHLPYVYNLAGSVKNKTLAWQNDLETDDYLTTCLQSISYELGIMETCNCKCKGCVLHIGSIGATKDVKRKEQGLQAVATSINKLSFSPKQTSKLLLETMVGNGGVLGTSFEDLAYVMSQLEKDKKEHVGICIDTCHVFASGQYDLRKETEVDRMFTSFQSHFNIDTLGLIHLNDSKGSFGDQKDRHTCITTGEIWKEHQSSLLHLLRKCKFHSIPVVLETTEEDFTTLQALWKKC